jgi:hypothetical protein
LHDADLLAAHAEATPAGAGSQALRTPRRLTEEDAVAIWMARWLRVKRRDLTRRFACDPRRLYEIWTQERFPESRAKAMALFGERYPGLVERIDYGPHRRLPRHATLDGQLSLFDDVAPSPPARSRRARREQK